QRHGLHPETNSPECTAARRRPGQSRDAVDAGASDLPRSSVEFPAHLCGAWSAAAGSLERRSSALTWLLVRWNCPPTRRHSSNTRLIRPRRLSGPCALRHNRYDQVVRWFRGAARLDFETRLALQHLVTAVVGYDRPRRRPKAARSSGTSAIG